jgi:SAM-dependent methyltransferase
VTRPAAYSFTRYLAAKKTVDDRSLNRRVWDRLRQAVQRRPEPAPLRVLEVGCGIGTMIERLLEWGLLGQAVYTAIDAEAANLTAARERLRGLAAAPNAAGPAPPDPAPLDSGPLLIQSATRKVRVELETIDLFQFAAREQGRSSRSSRPSWDLLIAHAFLDLLDLAAALPAMFSLLRPGGLFYFTLNFDGATILEPVIDPPLDRQIETLYHGTMDQRRLAGQPAGHSRTGRRLFGHLKAAGARVLAAGASDWVVFPGEEGYPDDEAYFLHFIIETMRRALEGHTQLDAGRFQDWIEARHRQIEAGQLIYIAHQLDFFGYI